MTSRFPILSAAIALVLTIPPITVYADDEGDILDVVLKAVAALNAKDVNTLKSLHLPDGQIYGVSREGLDYRNHHIFLEHISASHDAVHEVIWNPIVMSRDMVATVWTDYRVTQNDTLSHCGVNAFHLLKTDKGWRISSVDYTIRTDNCD